MHGIPGERILNAGDLVSIDTACRLAGWCADSAWTFAVGPIDENKQRLLSVCQQVLELAIAEAGRQKRWSAVAALMSDAVHKAGFSVVEDLVGHGIGREMHEDPQVPNYVSESLRQADFSLEPGLVLAIEPMINAGSNRTRTSKKDHWTVRTEDGQPSVHFEHSVALTATGPVVLTLPSKPTNRRNRDPATGPELSRTGRPDSWPQFPPSQKIGRIFGRPYLWPSLCLAYNRSIPSWGNLGR